MEQLCEHCGGRGYARILGKFKADNGWLYCIYCRGKQVVKPSVPKKESNAETTELQEGARKHPV